MGKYLNLLCLVLFLFSCGNEDVKLEESNVVATEMARKNLSINSTKTFNFDELTNTAIGYDNEGKVELGVTDYKIMETFILYSKLHNSQLNPKSFEIIEIDELHYLRFFSEDDIVSTIALVKDGNDQYITGRTICESKRCASGGGCIPDGQYCTKCEVNTLPGDCKRTTISEPSYPDA